MLIAIDGPIGVGKTTLTKKLAETLSAHTVLEFVDDKLLSSFYHREEGSALRLQFQLLYNRFIQQTGLKSRIEEHPFILCDYVFEKNMIFAELTLSKEDLALFQPYYALFSREVPAPDVVVYLQGSVPSIRDRIRSRGRTSEKHIKSNYIERVVEGYQRFFFDHPPAKMLVVNTDDVDIPRVVEDVEDIKEVILSTPPGISYYHPPGSGSDRDGGW